MRRGTEMCQFLRVFLPTLVEKQTRKSLFMFPLQLVEQTLLYELLREYFFSFHLGWVVLTL